MCIGGPSAPAPVAPVPAPPPPDPAPTPISKTGSQAQAQNTQAKGINSLTNPLTIPLGGAPSGSAGSGLAIPVG